MSDFDYERDRLGPEKEQLSAHVMNGVMQILAAATKKMNHPGENACLLAGSALPALMGISTLFGDADTIDDVKMDEDSITWGALFILNSLEKHPAGFVAGFSPAIIAKTQDDFKAKTGREFKLGQGPTALVQAYRDKINGTLVPEHLKKFVG